MATHQRWVETHEKRVELEEELESRLSDFEHIVVRWELDKFVQNLGKLGYNLAAYICNNPNCEKFDYESRVAAETSWGMYLSQNYPLSGTEQEELLEKGMEAVDVPLHSVSAPLETIEIVVGPEDLSEEFKILGWYCSTECARTSDIPSGYFAVTCSVYVLHPPDIKRTSVAPDIHRVLGPTPDRPRHRVTDFLSGIETQY